MGEAIKFGRGKLRVLDPVFANNEWEDIVSACQSGRVPDTWKVGDQKKMKINGTDYPIDIIGINHDDYADGSGKAPLTFQLHDLYSKRVRLHSSNSNSCGWKNCEFRLTTLPSILALMPTEVQSGVREVNKVTSTGNGNSTLETTADKLFLPSQIEVTGTTTSMQAATGEGTRYAYYSNGGSAKKCIVEDTTARYWFTRSPCIGNTIGFMAISESGLGGTNYGPASSVWHPFAFCF